LINGSGAVRLDRLTEAVTHILVIGSKISPQELELIRKLDPVYVGYRAQLYISSFGLAENFSC